MAATMHDLLTIMIERGASDLHITTGTPPPIRVIPIKIRSFDELGLPAVVEQLADRPKGLILVTGPTGSGKSTTLAAMVDKINSERSEHIMHIEDPNELVH